MHLLLCKRDLTQIRVSEVNDGKLSFPESPYTEDTTILHIEVSTLF